MEAGNVKIYESNQIDNNFKINGLIKNVKIQNIDETFEKFRISLDISLVLLVNNKDIETFNIDSMTGELSINGSRICEINRKEVIKFNKYGYGMWQSFTIYNDVNKPDMVHIRKLVKSKKECRLNYLGKIHYEKDKNVQIDFEYMLPKYELDMEMNKCLNNHDDEIRVEKEKLKRLLASLLKIRLEHYLVSDHFEHICLENDIDKLWKTLYNDTLGKSSVTILTTFPYSGYAKDTLPVFLEELINRDNFLEILDDILLDFLNWKKLYVDLSEIKERLIDLGYPTETVNTMKIFSDDIYKKINKKSMLKTIIGTKYVVSISKIFMTIGIIGYILYKFPTMLAEILIGPVAIVAIYILYKKFPIVSKEILIGATATIVGGLILYHVFSIGK